MTNLKSPSAITLRLSHAQCPSSIFFSFQDNLSPRFSTLSLFAVYVSAYTHLFGWRVFTNVYQRSSFSYHAIPRQRPARCLG